MYGINKNSKSQNKREDGEKPFWISFSDLMSSLMVLFLISMTVALLAITKDQPDEAEPLIVDMYGIKFKPIVTENDEKKNQEKAINEFMQGVKKILSNNEFKGVTLEDTTINFGQQGTFQEGQNTLSPEASQMLRSFTVQLLRLLKTTDAGRVWFKRAVVEGYASKTGTYLFNLNLSLERSQRVLCELLREPLNSTEVIFSDEDRRLMATSFFVGGASFNSLRSVGDALSRRIEIKLEFKTIDEAHNDQEFAKLDDAELIKALDPKEKCPISR